MGAWNRLGEVLPAWFRILSATADPGEYVQRVDAILKKHYDYGRGKMLSVARRVATPGKTPSPAKIVTSSGVNQDRISEYQHFGFSAVNEPFSFFERQAACDVDKQIT